MMKSTVEGTSFENYFMQPAVKKATQARRVPYTSKMYVQYPARHDIRIESKLSHSSAVRSVCSDYKQISLALERIVQSDAEQLRTAQSSRDLLKREKLPRTIWCYGIF